MRPIPLARSDLRRDLAIAGAYALLALAFTWPLAAHLTTQVIGTDGDNFEYVWKMWWVSHALFDLHTSPLIQPDIYYPFGYFLAYGEITPLHTYFAAPLVRLIGEVLTYNLIVLISAPLTGWMTYRLARRWLTPAPDAPEWLVTAAAFFAGLLVTFSAYRGFHTQGHLPLVDTQWIVLAVWGLDGWIETRALRDAAIAALAISLAALGSWYYALMLMIMLPVYLIARVPDVRSLLRDRRAWLSAGVVTAITGILCVPFMIPYLQLQAQDPALFKLTVIQASVWAASPTDYLLPNLTHPLWGDAMRQISWQLPGEPPGEFGSASIGIITLLFGLWGMRQVSGGRWRATRWLAGVALLLSFGPILFIGRLPTMIPLPAMLLHFLPVAESFRVWGRFSLFVKLALSLFAGAGLLAFAASLRTRRAQIAVCLIVTGLALFEAYSMPSLKEVGPRPVDTWLASQPGDFAIMQYPLSDALTGRQMLYTRYHGKKIVFGYGTFLPLVYTDRHPALLTFPDDAALDQLQAWGVRYVLVNIEKPHDVSLAAVSRSPRLKHIVTVDGQAVYELLKKP